MVGFFSMCQIDNGIVAKSGSSLKGFKICKSSYTN